VESDELPKPLRSQMAKVLQEDWLQTIQEGKESAGVLRGEILVTCFQSGRLSCAHGCLPVHALLPVKPFSSGRGK
jgi:hypothetical protein